MVFNPRGRTIGGKKFTSFVSFKNKAEANKTATRLRSRGDLVRVIKTKKMVAGRKFPFTVFTSKGRKR